MTWVLLSPLLPIAVFAVFVLLPGRVRNSLLWASVAVMAASTIVAIAALVVVLRAGATGDEEVWRLAFDFARLNGQGVELSFALTPLAAMMMVTVSIVATCVQVYSLGYMRDDKRRGWYFAVLSLFTAAMLTLVLGANLLLMFAAWELMGLCSYLLIGFWYENEEPRKASIKAFLTTRVGDLGFMVALFAIYAENQTFDLVTVLSRVPEWPMATTVVIAIGLLWAAMGKSAQIPLHAWLPDAMAGPTPASALIHAATMVAAGVLVVARTLPIMAEVPAVMTAMLIIGCATALLAAMMATVQHDIKKILAYSTVSQLGLMFVALGSGSAVATLFHLTTHAFFKSLLFLGAGVVIHAVHTQDIREMGGLAKRMKWSSAAFGIGTLALAGVPPLSGFFSKDEILAVVLHNENWGALAAVIVTSVLTAYYMTRLWFRVFAGPVKDDHAHEGEPLMVGPMLLLATIAAIGGAGAVRFSGLLGHEGHWPSVQLIAMSLAIAGLGIGVGWLWFGRQDHLLDTAAVKARFAGPYAVVANKFYVDHLYGALVKGYFAASAMLARFDKQVIDGIVNGAAKAYQWLADMSYRFDARVVDGAVNGVARLSGAVGTQARRLQTGQTQVYQRLVAAAVVTALGGYVVFDLVTKGV